MGTKAATKGLIVLTLQDKMKDLLMKLEPFACADETERQAILDGTKELKVVFETDNDGIMSARLELITGGGSGSGGGSGG